MPSYPACRGFSIGLGVRCQYCHVGEEGQPLATFDFKSDAKATKQKARVMMKMRDAINSTYLTQLGKREGDLLQVTCVTCHHGQARPETLGQILMTEVEQNGVDSALKKYRDLRQRYYGGFTYDFGERSLIFLANKLASGGKTDAAMAMLKLNLDFHPASAFTFYSMAELDLVNNDKQLAIEHMQKAVELNPNNPRAKRRLQELLKQ